jgi:hypothetical protein
MSSLNISCVNNDESFDYVYQTCCIPFKHIPYDVALTYGLNKTILFNQSIQDFLASEDEQRLLNVTNDVDFPHLFEQISVFVILMYVITLGSSILGLCIILRNLVLSKCKLYPLPFRFIVGHYITAEKYWYPLNVKNKTCCEKMNRYCNIWRFDYLYVWYGIVITSFCAAYFIMIALYAKFSVVRDSSQYSISTLNQLILTFFILVGMIVPVTLFLSIHHDRKKVIRVASKSKLTVEQEDKIIECCTTLYKQGFVNYYKTIYRQDAFLDIGMWTLYSDDMHFDWKVNFTSSNDDELSIDLEGQKDNNNDDDDNNNNNYNPSLHYAITTSSSLNGTDLQDLEIVRKEDQKTPFMQQQEKNLVPKRGNNRNHYKPKSSHLVYPISPHHIIEEEEKVYSSYHPDIHSRPPSPSVNNNNKKTNEDDNSKTSVNNVSNKEEKEIKEIVRNIAEPHIHNNNNNNKKETSYDVVVEEEDDEEEEEGVLYDPNHIVEVTTVEGAKVNSSS